MSTSGSYSTGYVNSDSDNIMQYDMIHDDNDDENSLPAKRGRSLLTLILWFIILAVIAWIVLWSWRPIFVQNTDSQGNPTNEPNGAKVLIASMIVALLIIIVVYLIFYSNSPC